MSRVVEQTDVREVMTLECLADNGQWVEKAVTAAQVAELLRTGGVQPDAEVTGGRPLCGDYREALAWLRRELPKVRGLGLDFESRIEKVPALRPMARLTLHDNQFFYQNFSGVVCLDIMNVYSEEERECIRRAVRVLPMTLMAFVGSSGMSMKVLVRVRPSRLELIQTPDTLNDFIRLAYKQMRVIYGNVIPQMIQNLVGTEGSAEPEDTDSIAAQDSMAPEIVEGERLPFEQAFTPGTFPAEIGDSSSSGNFSFAKLNDISIYGTTDELYSSGIVLLDLTAGKDAETEDVEIQTACSTRLDAGENQFTRC